MKQTGRRFKQEKGISLRDYINEVMIEWAKLLLSTTNLPVVEISEQLHYCSASYFTKTFRELTSIPPVEYRESM